MFEKPYNYPQSYYNSYNYPYYSKPNHPTLKSNYTTDAQTPFELYSKPKQPAGWRPNYYAGNMYYPKPKNSNLTYYFQNTEGELDINKMLSTVGQAASVVQQLTPLVKQFGFFMKQPK
ncbi:YppG family protein [Virgibacillus kekensis]|uniref:YppG family protein n=1 Tax=Virgibacillus kekensis TaxID=202261 RepID=A0ABV9DLZ6_9BACI